MENISAFDIVQAIVLSIIIINEIRISLFLRKIDEDDEVLPDGRFKCQECGNMDRYGEEYRDPDNLCYGCRCKEIDKNLGILKTTGLYHKFRDEVTDLFVLENAVRHKLSAEDMPKLGRHVFVKVGKKYVKACLVKTPDFGTNYFEEVGDENARCFDLEEVSEWAVIE